MLAAIANTRTNTQLAGSERVFALRREKQSFASDTIAQCCWSSSSSAAAAAAVNYTPTARRPNLVQCGCCERLFKLLLLLLWRQHQLSGVEAAAAAAIDWSLGLVFPSSLSLSICSCSCLCVGIDFRLKLFLAAQLGVVVH